MRERFLLQSEVQLVLFWSDYQERSSIKPASTCNPFRNYSKTRSNIHFTFFRNWISNLSFIQFIQSIAWPGDAKCGRENEKLSIVQQSNILSRLFSWTGSCFVRLFVSIRKCFDKDSRCPTERKGCGKVDWEQRIVKTKLRYHQFVLSGGNESYIIRVSVREKH